MRCLATWQATRGGRELQSRDRPAPTSLSAVGTTDLSPASETTDAGAQYAMIAPGQTGTDALDVELLPTEPDVKRWTLWSRARIWADSVFTPWLLCPPSSLSPP